MRSDLGARLAIEAGAASIEHLRSLSRETFDRAAERHAAFQILLESGAHVANGSDLGAYPRAIGPLLELRLLVTAGMTPLAALRAATGEVAALLGQPDLGAIAPGKIADLCVWPDLKFEQKPSLVIKAGRIVRR